MKKYSKDNICGCAVRCWWTGFIEILFSFDAKTLFFPQLYRQTNVFQIISVS